MPAARQRNTSDWTVPVSPSATSSRSGSPRQHTHAHRISAAFTAGRQVLADLGGMRWSWSAKGQGLRPGCRAMPASDIARPFAVRPLSGSPSGHSTGQVITLFLDRVTIQRSP